MTVTLAYRVNHVLNDNLNYSKVDLSSWTIEWFDQIILVDVSIWHHAILLLCSKKKNATKIIRNWIIFDRNTTTHMERHTEIKMV